MALDKSSKGSNRVSFSLSHLEVGFAYICCLPAIPAARLRSVSGVNDPAEWQLCVHPDVHGPPHAAGLDAWLKAVTEPIVGVLIVVIYHILLLVRQLEREE